MADSGVTTATIHAGVLGARTLDDRTAISGPAEAVIEGRSDPEPPDLDGDNDVVRRADAVMTIVCVRRVVEQLSDTDLGRETVSAVIVLSLDTDTATVSVTLETGCEALRVSDANVQDRAADNVTEKDVEIVMQSPQRCCG